MGIAEVQARIAEIQTRFAPAPPVMAGSPDSFRTSLAAAQGVDRAAPVSGDSGRYDAFSRDLLAALGMPGTAENVRAIKAWAAAEGTRAAYNPLATTQSMPGATDFNSVGVKNYASYADGLAATVKTLRNGRYDAILAALARGDSAIAVAEAVADSPWGTGDGVLKRLGAQ